jgi:predicted O-linked N-acetylglucosamine transferase (SPINDLY family)
MSTCPDAKYRNPALAVRAAKKAIQLGGKDCRGLDTLAAALASAGQFETASQTGRDAVAAAPADAHEMLQHRLSLYQSHQPYYEPELDPNVRLAAAQEPSE